MSNPAAFEYSGLHDLDNRCSGRPFNLSRNGVKRAASRLDCETIIDGNAPGGDECGRIHARLIVFGATVQNSS